MRFILWGLLLIITPFSVQHGVADTGIEKLRRIKAQVEAPSPASIDAENDALLQARYASSGSLELDEEEESLLVRAIKGLSLCLGVFFVFIYFLKKKHGIKTTSRERRLLLKEQMSLGGKNSVALIALDGREMIIGISENSVQLLQAQRSQAKRADAQRTAISPQSIPVKHAKVASCINE